MSRYHWVRREVVLAIHNEQLAEHGGLAGIRDEGMLDAGLARPLQVEAYGEPDVETLAAAYVYGIARNHPLLDGNKRTAFVVGELFLALNGLDLTARDEDCVLTMLQVADGSLAEDRFVDWLKAHTEPRG